MNIPAPTTTGKETASLLHSFNWAGTSLGPSNLWPEALEIVVGLCFSRKQPALIAWGPEFIQIYNDAYAELIGGQHPLSFGRPGRESWSKQWDQIAPMLQSVIKDGKSYHVENHLFTVSRNGYPEDCYFTFSYEPIRTRQGIVGIFVNVVETTQQVVSQKRLRELRNEQLRSLFMQAPVAMALLTGPDFVVDIVNEKMLEIWGKPSVDILNKSVVDALAEAKVQGFHELVNKVYRTGERIVFEEIPITLIRAGKNENLIIKFVYAPLTENDGIITGVMVLADDVTEQALLRRRIQENEERMRMAIRSTRLGTWEYSVGLQEFVSSVECRNIFGISDEYQNDYAIFNGCVHPADRKMIRTAIDAAKADHSEGNFEVVHRIVRHNNKMVRWVRSWGKIFFDKDHQSEKYIGTVIDITDQKTIEETLRKNESRARLAIEAAGLGTYEYDVALDRWQHSERMAHIFGMADSKELNHVSFSKLIHPEDRHIRDKAISIIEKTGLLFYEVRVIWPDATIHWVRINGVLLENDEGMPSVLYGTAQDITDSKMQSESLERIVAERTASLVDTITMLKRAEDKLTENTEALKLRNQELRESEERYHRMIDEVQDYAIILLDADGIIQNWNEGAEKIKQYVAEEAIGQHFSIFYLPADREQQLPKKLISLATEFGRATHEGWRIRKDGSRFWGSIVITALHQTDGKVIGFSKVTRDLTERKAAEDKLVEYTVELEARNKELEQFAFVASHDLQEPLRKIQTFTELIQRNLHDENLLNRYFGKIEVSAQRMRDLIHATLNYSTFSREDLEAADVDLNKVLGEVKTDNEIIIQTKNAAIHAAELPVVRGNAIQLGQVFSNLIGNAIKFSDKVPVVEISSRLISKDQVRDSPAGLSEEKYYEVVVRDNGIGFEEQYQKKIFAIFQRLHGKDRYPGTGIGLALCKKIMENHKGYITALGEPGKGASFFLYFPCIV